MKSLSYWKGRSEAFLQGEEATDEEYEAVMKSLGE
jgi:hypothetical protein